jgi:hypothetical protein
MQKYAVEDFNPDALVSLKNLSVEKIITEKAILEDFIAEAIDRFEETCSGIEVSSITLYFSDQKIAGKEDKKPITVAVDVTFPKYRKDTLV